MRRSLHLSGVGPAPRFDMEFGERLNVLTGDNGLGKSFALEVAWWVLTETWVGRPALPRHDSTSTPSIIAAREVGLGGPLEFIGDYSNATQTWRRNPEKDSPVVHGLFLNNRAMHGCPVLYARADGGFSVWDPARNYRAPEKRWGVADQDAYHFEHDSLWNGLKRDEKTICNGLIQDWVSWQQERESETQPFRLLCQALEALSHPREPMKPGKPRRLFVDDARRFPTLDLPYDNVPVIHASAGMQRILSLAYLIVWAWSEHLEACKLLQQEPAKQIVFLMDEVETHLHPQWQRHILRALLRVLKGLSPSMQTQVLLTTHSPLVLASLEPEFQPAHDKLFLFELENSEVSLRELPWTKRGDAIGWLTSEVFGLEQARSIEAERAIEAAEALMRGDLTALPPDLSNEETIHRELVRVLPDQDRFWPRWIIQRERRADDPVHPRQGA